MNKYVKYYKIGLFAFFVSLLLVTHLQKWRSVWKLEPLITYDPAPEVPEFSIETWLNGTYQKKKEKQIEETIGFRSLFVRVYNQYYYTFFKQARANGVLIGKDNYLYEEAYIKTALGEDFLGEEEISSRLDSLERISDYLESKNITLILVLAAGKGEFYPEYWPVEFDSKKPQKSNYLGFTENLNKRKIHALDLQKWFLEMKDTAQYPLYPKTGIHWSSYADILVADTLFQFVQKVRPSFNYPRIKPTNVRSSKRMFLRDDDIEKGMNLLFNIPDEPMVYADVLIKGDTANVSSNFLVIADSYYFGIDALLKDQTQLPRGSFWYYHQQVFPETYTQELLVEKLNYKQKIEENEVIVLLVTDANLKKVGFGFMKQFYEHYFYTE